MRQVVIFSPNCLTRSIGCYYIVEDFVLQSSLMNVGDLKTSGFLVLVKGSGIQGTKYLWKNRERQEMKL